MQFTNTFDVSLPPEKAWPLLMDVERIVPCMPGAELLEIIDDKTFKGKVAVKLGPVSLVFVCTAVFEEADAVTRRARIKANGSDAKGRGNANAIIAFSLEPSPKGTKVTITTDLSLFGAVAQYGRGAGMVESLANQIISQFSKNLEAQIPDIIAEESASQAAAPDVAPAVAASVPDTAGASQAATPAPVPAPRVLRPVQPAKPISGFSLLFASIRASVRNWFGGSAR